MGGLISTLAFPAPQLPREFYQDELMKRPDLVQFKTSNRENVWACHVRAERFGADFFPAATRPTLLYSHGNAEDLALHLDFIDMLSQCTGADVFSYDYVGYSLSRLEGHQPSEAGCYRSSEAAWRYCVEELKIPPSRIVIFGRSIGSGPAIDLASREKIEGTDHSPLDVRGVLLQSPIESGARAVFGWTVSMVGYAMDIFKNYEKIGNIRCKVAIMHGTADEVVPVGNGQNLHQMSRNKFQPLWIEGYGHNNMPYEECFNYTKRFLQELEPASPPRN